MAQQDTQAAGSGQTIKTHPLLDVARDLVITDQKASISYVQRKLKIGYNDAATLIDTLELEGVVSQLGPDFTRTVLGTKTTSNDWNAPAMAQPFTQAAGSPEEEPNRIYWARRAIQCERDSNSLAIMASGFGNTHKTRRALMAGAAALVAEADHYIHYATQCGGLLFCWADSRLEGGAA